MTEEYIIEVWTKKTNKYSIYWKSSDFERARIMMHKPYNSHNTRRLIRVTREILYTERAKNDFQN